MLERGKVDEAFTSAHHLHEGETSPSARVWVVFGKVDPLRYSLSCGMCVYPPLGHVTFAGRIRTGGQEHFYMETQSVLVVPAGEETELNVYISSQDPTAVQVRSL